MMRIVPTGIPVVDVATGIGGYPRGRLVQLYGPHDGGRIELMLHATAACQRDGGTVAYIDLAHAFDGDVAERFGVDVARLLVSQPYSDDAFDVAEAFAVGGARLLVIDPAELLVSPGHEGLAARRMSHGLRRLTSVARRTGTCVLFGSSDNAGNAFRFYASIRIDVRSTHGTTRAAITKNACGTPHKTAVFPAPQPAPETTT